MGGTANMTECCIIIIPMLEGSLYMVALEIRFVSLKIRLFDDLGFGAKAQRNFEIAG